MLYFRQLSSDEVVQLRAQLLVGKKELTRLKEENRELNSKLEASHGKVRIYIRRTLVSVARTAIFPALCT